MDPKRLALYLGAAAVALALYLAWLWQPERQVRLHTATFISAVEHRNWEKVEGLLADQYSDRWGHDKEIVLGALQQVFGQFVFLKIEKTVSPAVLAGGTGSTEAQVKMSGSGSQVAEVVVSKVNGLAGPFTFVWVQRSGKPWDWQLVKVDQASLEPGEFSF